MLLVCYTCFLFVGFSLCPYETSSEHGAPLLAWKRLDRYRSSTKRALIMYQTLRGSAGSRLFLLLFSFSSSSSLSSSSSSFFFFVLSSFQSSDGLRLHGLYSSACSSAAMTLLITRQGGDRITNSPVLLFFDPPACRSTRLSCTRTFVPFQIIFTAPEKKDKGKGKKNRGASRAAEDLSKGGIDGGLRHLLVLPFPVRPEVLILGRNKDGLVLRLDLQSVGTSWRQLVCLTCEAVKRGRERFRDEDGEGDGGL